VAGTIWVNRFLKRRGSYITCDIFGLMKNGLVRRQTLDMKSVNGGDRYEIATHFVGLKLGRPIFHIDKVLARGMTNHGANQH
jgi:hypothetical protein